MTEISCKQQPSLTQDDQLVAQVGDLTLTQNDLVLLTPPLPSHKDTITYQKNYVKNWVKNALIIHNFKQQNPDWKTSLQKKLQECENQILLTEALDQITQELLNNSNISSSTLYTFYLQHDSLFPASEPYYQFIFGVCQTLSTALLLRRSFLHDSLPLFISKLQQQALLSKTDTSWHTLKESQKILNQIQISPDLDQLSLNQPYLYWVKYEGKTLPALFILLNRVQKGDPIPFPLIQNEIKFFYLHNLKELYLDSLYNELYQKAQKNNAIHIYLNLD